MAVRMAWREFGRIHYACFHPDISNFIILLRVFTFIINGSVVCGLRGESECAAVCVILNPGHFYGADIHIPVITPLVCSRNRYVARWLGIAIVGQPLRLKGNGFNRFPVHPRLDAGNIFRKHDIVLTQNICDCMGGSCSLVRVNDVIFTLNSRIIGYVLVVAGGVKLTVLIVNRISDE